MSTKTTPNALSTTTQAMPSAVPSLTDWHTWMSLLTSVAALLAVVLHKDFSAYIPLVAILAAAGTNIALMVVKHRYAAALATASSAATQASSVAPAQIASEINRAAGIIQAVQNVQTAAAPIVQAAEQLPSTSQAQSA